MVESFWSIPDAAKVRTPLNILREQGTELTSQTSGILVGRVDTRTEDDQELTMALSIIVPALNDYRIRILEYRQPVTLYPGSMQGLGIGFIGKIKDEVEFVDSVKRCFASDDVKNALRSLLAQAQDI